MSILSNEFLSKYVGKQPNWGFNGLGRVVYQRTYSRVKDDGTKEDWWETVQRCVEGAQKIGAGYTKQEAESLYDKVFNLKCNFAGRMLWQLGTPTVDRFGGNSLLNCFYVSIQKTSDFEFLFENLMLGGGVGFSVRREDIHELPRVREDVQISHDNSKDADFIVPDSREGWVKLLRETLNAFFVTGKGFRYSTVLVRGAGERIKGFGGTASGPQILTEGIQNIANVLSGRAGKKMRSVDVLDVCDIIGSIVVAGNVRRSALISLGDPDDYLFLRAKNWDVGNVPNWRAMSNNTIYADDFSHISKDVWESFELNAETGRAKGEAYGFFNLPLSQKYGRLIDGPMKHCALYPTNKDNCSGTNPCAEINLESHESCNLSELYLNNIESKEELIECATLLYKTQKAVCALPFIHEETNKVVHKNFRIGVGVTGICQSIEKLEWLNDAYLALRKFDAEWSQQKGWPASIKLTTIKPSGTLSLLAGATPGVHPAYSRYYIRRIKMSSNDELVKSCRAAGYRVEYSRNFDGTDDRGSVVVEFPCESGEGAIVASEMTAVAQLELVKKLQTIWSDNAVSVTVYYHENELPAIKEWLAENYETSLKSVSFLLHSKHGFVQAPYEEISKEKYEELKSVVTPMTTVQGSGTLDVECASGACPIR